MKKQLVLKDNEYDKFSEFIKDCQIRGFVGINNYDRHIYHVREQFIRWHINELASRLGKGRKRHITLSLPEIMAIGIMKQRIECDDCIKPLLFKIGKLNIMGVMK